MTDLPKTVQVGDVEVRLGVPASFTLRQELIQLTATNVPRGMAACLVACWQAPKAKKPRVTLQQAGENMALYGRRCLDALIEAGHSPQDIRAAGAQAFAQISRKHGDGFWSEDEVSEAEGNSAGGAG